MLGKERGKYINTPLPSENSVLKGKKKIKAQDKKHNGGEGKKI